MGMQIDAAGIVPGGEAGNSEPETKAPSLPAGPAARVSGQVRSGQGDFAVSEGGSWSIFIRR